MNDIAIRVANLSKEYRIGAARQRHDTLRDQLVHGLSRLVRRNGKPRHATETFWALKDVSFDVRQGEVIGIIGRNGAGKSTVLKILSRITEPSDGMARMDGRVGSLLEVGTGFHPELTGRENIYLNAAILGMRRAEIEQKFDAIVGFSGVEKFIDTPVKRYSSGMYVRLAFSVAAHLDLEILLIDEVLAVGDVEFQKKCLGKMGEVANSGRTVIFVSHQMNHIRRLCQRVIWLERGSPRMIGPTAEVVGAYEAAMIGGQQNDGDRTEGPHVKARFLRWEIAEPRSDQPHMLTTLGPVTVGFALHTKRAIRNGHHGVGLYDADGQLLWGAAVDNMQLQPGEHVFRYSLPTLPLRPGVFRWRVSLYDDGALLDVWECMPQLLVGTEPVTHPRDEWAGVLNIPYRFCITTRESNIDRNGDLPLQ